MHLSSERHNVLSCTIVRDTDFIHMHRYGYWHLYGYWWWGGVLFCVYQEGVRRLTADVLQIICTTGAFNVNKFNF